EATGSMYWFLRLLEELEIDYRVGHPAGIRAAEPRKQKHDQRDARLIMRLLAEKRFPAIWIPSREHRDLQVLLRHRHQLVRIRTRIQLGLQALALSHGCVAAARSGPQEANTAFVLCPWLQMPPTNAIRCWRCIRSFRTPLTIWTARSRLKLNNDHSRFG